MLTSTMLKPARTIKGDQGRSREINAHQHDVEAGPHEKEEDHQEGGRHDLWGQGAVVSTCMLRILGKAPW
jgi:hypothetical protein